MPSAEFLPLAPSSIDVKSFDCGKDAPFYQSFKFFLPLTGNPMKLFVPMASLATL